MTTPIQCANCDRPFPAAELEQVCGEFLCDDCRLAADAEAEREFVAHKAIYDQFVLDAEYR